MKKAGFSKEDDFQAHKDKDWRVAHGIWPNIRGMTMAPRPKGGVGAHTHVKAAITDTPWSWTDVLKTGSNLTDLATRLHSSLQSIGANDHHPQSHTLASHSTKPHSALTDITENQHHNKLHSMTGVQHSATGLTVGHVLRATGAATFAWGFLTKLGTISTGVWQGTPVGNAYVAGIDQDLLTTSSPTHVTAKLTALTNNYIPYHISDASGLADSGLAWSATNEVLDIAGDIEGDADSKAYISVVPQLTRMLGFSSNQLFMADERFTVTVTGGVSNVPQPRWFDEMFTPANVVQDDPGTPVVITIEGLDANTVFGGYIGWVVRYRYPKHFTVEAWNPDLVDWVMVADYSVDTYASTSWVSDLLTPAKYTKIRYTLIEPNSGDYFQISELYFTHPEISPRILGVTGDFLIGGDAIIHSLTASTLLGAGVSKELKSLTTIAGLTTGHVLKATGATTVAFMANNLAGLSDVNIQTPIKYQSIYYISGEWVNRPEITYDMPYLSFKMYTDFFDKTETPPWKGYSVNGGGRADVAGTSSHPGIIRIQSSTQANSGYRYITGGSAGIYPIRIAGEEMAEIVFRVPSPPIAYKEFFYGYHRSSIPGVTVNGVYFHMDYYAFGAELRLYGICRASNVQSATAYYVLAGNTWYRARLEVNADATRVDFWLYNEGGDELWTAYITTNIPTSAGQEVAHSLIAWHTGTAVQNIVDVDFMAGVCFRPIARG